MPVTSPIDAVVERITPQLVALRRELHQHPELAFEEHLTAKTVADYLQRLGLSVTTGVGKTGVVGIIEGALSGPTVGVRADMDALPVEEQSGVAFASKIPGKMHACGHDVHTVIALGVAEVLCTMRERLPGRVKLIFQPAEETLNGASAMIDDGVLDAPAMDYILGYHNWPQLEAGSVGFYPSVIMASSDAFDIVLKGRAGHAAHPHTGIDAIIGAAQLVNQMQTIVSREIAPAIPAVVTIGQMNGGTARNVIADRVTLKGTVRTLDPAAATQIEQAIRRIVAGVATTLRLEYDIIWVRQTPVLMNDQKVLARVLVAARDALGGDRVVEMGPPSMGSEDFAWFAERVPAAHLRIGSRIAGLDTAIHRANYDCNELAIPTGIRAVSGAVLALLGEK